MRRVALFISVLLAGVAVELWLTVVGMSEAFSGGARLLPSSLSDLHEDWRYFGLLYGLPVLALSLAALAIKLWRKKPADA